MEGRDEHVHADNDVRQPSRPRPSCGNQGPCLPNTSGRGSVRVLVLNDRGRELAVDMKTIHGSRL
ncbi:Woronin body major protein like [Verticillium longisporum]|nr:Woronin body major protein like [Verticillium longisporum]